MITHTHKLVYACNCEPPIVPLLFLLNFYSTALIGFVHIFQLWTLPEQWTLLSSFVNGPLFKCVYLHYTHKHRRTRQTRQWGIKAIQTETG